MLSFDQPIILFTFFSHSSQRSSQDPIRGHQLQDIREAGEYRVAAAGRGRVSGSLAYPQDIDNSPVEKIQYPQDKYSLFNDTVTSRHIG